MIAGGVLLPAVAGTWYPSDPRRLAAMVDALLEAAADPPPAAPAALIAPHAGFEWSGAVAAVAFRALRGRRFARVVVLGPAHHEGFDGAAIPEADAWRSPLGDVPLDRTALRELAGRPGIRVAGSPFRREHSLEAELPFLQRALPGGFEAVPLLVGALSRAADLEDVARATEPLLDDGTLVVVSSDFTHHGQDFGFRPFREDVGRRIEDLDRGALERVEDGDAAGFERYVAETGATICGRHPIGVLLRLGPVRRSPARRTLAYATSGERTGTWDHSVSYAAVHVAASG